MGSQSRFFEGWNGSEESGEESRLWLLVCAPALGDALCTCPLVLGLRVPVIPVFIQVGI